MLNIIPLEIIENKIFPMRGQKVMIDRDLAKLYGVPTKRLNEQVKRNIRRFPDDFMFQLTKMEADILISQNEISSSRSQFATLNKKGEENKLYLRSQIATSNEVNSERKPNNRSQFATSNRGGRRYMPYVFTEQGVAMLSSVLDSEKAILVNIAIMRTFVNIRKFTSTYEGLAMKIAEMEKKYDRRIFKIFEVLKELTKTGENEKKIEIGFKG